MNRTAFAALLKKYQSGNASPEEREIVEQWYALLDEHPRAISPGEWTKLETRLWQRLQKRIAGETDEIEPKVIPFWRTTYARVGIAASIILVITLGYVFTVKNNLTNDQSAKLAGLELVVNNTSSDMSITLSDSSKVMLAQGGELRFPKQFAAAKREVFLTGEAFFSVRENPNRPFLVNAGLITTKVLGTSFWVKAPQHGAEVEVAVKTGKVSVYENGATTLVKSSKNGNGVILKPNHRVTFLTNTKLFITRLVDNPEVVATVKTPAAKAFDYNDAPLASVLGDLEETYAIDIDLDKKALGECPLTANLSRKGLYAQLDILCAVIEGTYEVKGTTILISGKGCDTNSN